VFCDNNSAIVLSKNHMFHKKTKHIDTRYHFISELVNYQKNYLEFCSSKGQIEDIFTKSLARDSFQKLHSCQGVNIVPDT